jgi:hypothetical protein
MSREKRAIWRREACMFLAFVRLDKKGCKKDVTPLKYFDRRDKMLDKAA